MDQSINPPPLPLPLPLLLLLLLLGSMHLTSHLSTAANLFNVVDYGADPTTKWGSTKAFLVAWKLACRSTEPAVVRVPKGRFLIGPVNFKGPCKNAMKFSIAGTIIAPLNYNIAGVSGKWIQFSRVVGLSITGGIIDGRGARFWDCKTSGKSCPQGATSMNIDHCNKTTITRVTSVNSALFHIVIHASDSIKMQAIVIRAPDESPNTDGIHIQYSNKVTIDAASINTGDDCIAIGPGNTNLYIDGVSCGPGHGISIGSLANSLDEPGVENVTVKTVRFTGTQNGFRIKTWARASNGFVTGVLFQNAIMNNVRFPIVIEQNYCPNNISCPTEGSGIKIKDVTYNHIRGTSSSQVAVKFDCSPKHPCEGIRMTGIQLTYGDQPALSYCENARGSAFGVVNPPSCLAK